MSICVYTLSPAELARRIVPRYQRAALAPFPSPREHAAPWGLNRVPLNFRELTEEGWTELELPREPPTPGPGPGPGRPSPALRPPAAAPGGFVGHIAEQRGFVVMMDGAGGGNGYEHKSFGPLPWPFEIVGCVSTVDQASTNLVHWGLFVNNGLVRGSFTTPQGVPLLQPVVGAADGTVLSDGGTFLAFSETGSLLTMHNLSPASTYVGTAIYDPNQYLTVIMRQPAATVKRLAVAITVRQLMPHPVETRGNSLPAPRPQAAPSPAPRPASTPARAPAPRRILEGASRSGTAVWGPGGGNPTPWAGFGAGERLARGGI